MSTSIRNSEREVGKPQESGPSILVVEDEESIRRGLCDVLAYHRYAPHGEERGDTGLATALAGEFALVILDLMLPGRSGFDVCRELRAAGSDAPVLMLTARGSEDDVLEGFRCGADDYVTKPFRVAELMARVEALLRRSGALERDGEGEAEPFEIGAWTIHADDLCARSGDEECALSRLEMQILTLLAEERSRIVSRRQLLAEVWGYERPEKIETRTVDMHIAKLRRKLGPDAADLIETIRGEGYQLRG